MITLRTKGNNCYVTEHRNNRKFTAIFDDFLTALKFIKALRGELAK